MNKVIKLHKAHVKANMGIIMGIYLKERWFTNLSSLAGIECIYIEYGLLSYLEESICEQVL